MLFVRLNSRNSQLPAAAAQCCLQQHAPTCTASHVVAIMALSNSLAPPLWLCCCCLAAAGACLLCDGVCAAGGPGGDKLQVDGLGAHLPAGGAVLLLPVAGLLHGLHPHLPGRGLDHDLLGVSAGQVGAVLAELSSTLLRQCRCCAYAGSVSDALAAGLVCGWRRGVMRSWRVLRPAHCGSGCVVAGTASWRCCSACSACCPCRRSCTWSCAPSPPMAGAGCGPGT